MRLCISATACANLTWANDHYDGRGDNEIEVSSRYWIKTWEPDHVELEGKTAKAVDGVNPAEGTFHGRIAPGGGSLVDAVYDWRIGHGKAGTSAFTLTWETDLSNGVAANGKGEAEASRHSRPDSPPPGVLPTSAAQPTTQRKQVEDLAAGIPGAILQCESDQCTRGGGGAVWLFQGRNGQAMWHYGAIANLTVERFDGHTIVIHREDPNPSYSSPQFADLSKRSDGVFFADYVGTIHGDRIDGTVQWNGGGRGTWYATIPKTLCVPFEQCPLDMHQFMQLGQNAVRAKLYTPALHCFLIGAAQGDAEAQSLAGLMLRDGQGVPANERAAFYFLSNSAEQGDYNGELGLSQMYALGLGTAKDQERAAFWRNRAEDRLRQIRAEQQQQASSNALGLLLFMGMAAALMGDSGSSESASPSHSSSPADDFRKQQQRDRDFDYWYNRGTGLSAPTGYKCTGAYC